VLDRVEKEVRDLSDPFCAVVMGVDDPWDVCLVKLFWEVIQSSATANIRELEKRRMFDDVGGVPRAVREEIEADFLAASRNAALIKPLAKKLQGYRLFDEYQDRFFALIRASKRQG
jgi:hypothetical protein